MNFCDFIALTNAQQLQTVQDFGTYLCCRKDPVHRISLYQVFDFYVEVYFNLNQLQITMRSAIHANRIQELYSDLTLFDTPDQKRKRSTTSLLPT